jgi:hypothetical protein
MSPDDAVAAGTATELGTEADAGGAADATASKADTTPTPGTAHRRGDPPRVRDTNITSPPFCYRAVPAKAASRYHGVGSARKVRRRRLRTGHSVRFFLSTAPAASRRLTLAHTGQLLGTVPDSGQTGAEEVRP